MATSSVPAAPAAPAAPLVTIRSGPRYWLTSYLLMVRWEFLSMRLILPLMLVVQLLIGAGIVIGFGFLFSRMETEQALYLATGSAVIPLLTVGLVMVPQEVSSYKLDGTYGFLWSLPVPRMAFYLAGLTVWSIIALPGAALALTAAALRYDLPIHVSPALLPAVLLVVMVASAVGYAMGHAIPSPRLINLITQVLIFVILLFSPVNFPAERLPEWLQWAHQWLPPQHAAAVVRGTLTEGLVADLGRSFLVLGGWAVLSWLITYRVLTRRP